MLFFNRRRPSGAALRSRLANDWIFVALGLALFAAIALNLWLRSSNEVLAQTGLEPDAAYANLPSSEAILRDLKSIRFLRSEVYAEYPALDGGNLCDFERVTLLRQWAWSHSRTSLANDSSNLLDLDPGNDWNNLDAEEVFELFKKDRGGVLCSGSAYALMRLYEMCGFRAWIVSSGEGNISHAITVVEIETPTGTRLSPQDAYFNLTYVDAETNEPLDYLEMLTRLAACRHSSIQTLEADWREIPVWPSTIVARQDLGDRQVKSIARTAFSVMESAYAARRLPNGSLKITSPRTYGMFLNKLCRDEHGNPQGFLKWIADQGHPPDMNYLLLYPYDVYGKDREDLFKKACAIAAPAQRPKRREVF